MEEEQVITQGTEAGAGEVQQDTGLDTGLDTQFEQETQDTGQEQSQRETPQIKEEPETAEFRGNATGRIRNLVKRSPELGPVLEKYPELKNHIEAAFRQNAGYRDAFPTLAEARAMRERFPNGLQDVQEMQNDLDEMSSIDDAFLTQDQDGRFPGHVDYINNIFNLNRNATLSMLDTAIKEWPRLDRNSYNTVMGKIVGATLVGTGMYEALMELRESANGNDATKGLVGTLDKVLARMNGFIEERQPTKEDQELARQRASFDREKSEYGKQDQANFDKSFGQSNMRLQREIIGNHKAIQRLAQVKSISEQKRADIIEKVRLGMEQFLRNSPSFMRKLTDAYNKRDMNEAVKVQKSYWEQEWLLNRTIRNVFRTEVPQLVRTNQETVQKRVGAPQQKTTPQANGKRTSPYKQGGQWHWPDGRTMTVEETMKAQMSGQIKLE